MELSFGEPGPPYIEIESLSQSGLLVIKFSHPFVIVEDLSLLKDIYHKGASDQTI